MIDPGDPIVVQKRLFEVMVEKIVYVMAVNADEAELEARTYEGEEEGAVSGCREIKVIEDIPPQDLDSLPWGDDSGKDMTLREILALPAPPEPPYDDPNQMKIGFP